MRQILAIVLLVMAVFAAVLQWKDGSFSGREDRVNSAVPPGPEIKTALDELKSRSDGKLPSGIADEYDNRMRLRALKCSQDISIGFTTSKQRIRSLLEHSPCIAEADASVAEWIGARTIGLVASGAPIKTVINPEKRFISGQQRGVNRILPATNAAVVAIDSYKDVEVVGLGDGQVISTIPHKDNRVLDSISPNGRIVAISAYQDSTLELYDGLTGAQVSILKQANIGIGTKHLYWLDDRVALTQVASPPQVVLQDFKTDKQYPMPSSIELGSTLVQVSNSPAEYIAFNNSSLTKLKLTYDSDVPHVEVLDLRSVRFNTNAPSGSGITADKKYIVDCSNGDMLLTPTDSMVAQTITVQPFFIRYVWPTSDPDRILVTGYVKNLPNKSKLYLYSISGNSMFEVNAESFTSYAFLYLPSIKKIANQTNDGLQLVDSFTTGARIEMAAFVEQAQVEYDARLQPVAAVPPFGADGQFVNRNSAFQESKTFVGQGANQAFLLDLAQDAEIRGVGVYQAQQVPAGASAAGGTTTTLSIGTGVVTIRSHDPVRPLAPPASIHVRVKPTTRPLILVLSSFDPVHWALDLDPGSRLKAVMLSSQKGADVTGQGPARVVTIGSVASYQPYSPNYDQLQKAVVQWTGKQMTQFQGSYQASSFQVGGPQ